MCLLFVCVSVSPRYIHISAQNSLEAQKAVHEGRFVWPRQDGPKVQQSVLLRIHRVERLNAERSRSNTRFSMHYLMRLHQATQLFSMNYNADRNH